MSADAAAPGFGSGSAPARAGQTPTSGLGPAPASGSAPGDPPAPRVAHYRTPWLALSETFIHEVVRRHRRYEPVVVTHERRNPDRFGTDAQVEVTHDSDGRTVGRWLHASAALRILDRRRALKPALARLAPTLVHAHFGEEGVIASAEAERLGVPLVVSFYGFDATHLGAHALWRRRFRSLFRTAALALAEGPHLRRRLVELGCPPARARIQRIPVRLELFPFRPRSLPEDGPVIFLQACRFVEKKGLDLTVEAFARIASSRPRAELWLLGDGPERVRLEARVARAALGGRVRFLGMCGHEEYARVLEAAHVFVQPSRTAADGDGEGGAPTTLLEAQASGMPLVTSDHADIPWVVAGDGALVVPEGDVSAVAAAMERLLEHPEEWEARAEAGRRKVEAGHDPERLVAELETLYDEATGRAPERDSRPGAAGTDRPLVSVILPTRDRADLLKRAVESVRAQSLDDWELIVVDDASTDRTGELLDTLSGSEPRLRVLTADRPGGGSAARNRGVHEARGRWVAFLDDDDTWLPDKLERQCARLRGAGAGAVLAYCPYLYVGSDGREEVHGTIDATGRDAWRLLLRGNFVGNSTVVARREAVVAAGGWDESLPRLQDLDLWLRLARRGGFVFEPRALARVHWTAGSISERPDALVSAARTVLDKVRDEGAGRSEMADLCYSLGHELMRQEAPGEGGRLLRRALRLRPWPPRRWVMTAVAALGEGPYALTTRLHRSVAGHA